MRGCCVDKACTPNTCMELPEGETCGNCVYLRRCRAFGYTGGSSQTSCDFHPRRFLAAEADTPGPQPEQTTSQELGRSMP